MRLALLIWEVVCLVFVFVVFCMVIIDNGRLLKRCHELERETFVLREQLIAYRHPPAIHPQCPSCGNFIRDESDHVPGCARDRSF